MIAFEGLNREDLVPNIQIIFDRDRSIFNGLFRLVLTGKMYVTIFKVYFMIPLSSIDGDRFLNL